MSTFQDDIILTVLQAKDIAACWADNFISREANGEDVNCCELKMMLLIEWIFMAEDYYYQNYNNNGNKTPDIQCLTLSQMETLLAKIKALIS